MQYKNLDNLTQQQYDYYKERDNLNITLPSIAVDAIILAEKNNELYILLQKYDEPFILNGVYNLIELGLIGSFIQTGLSFKDNLNQIVYQKTGLDISNDYKKQIAIYDNPNRDNRGHIITTSYIVFTDYKEVNNCMWVKIDNDNIKNNHHVYINFEEQYFDDDFPFYPYITLNKKEVDDDQSFDYKLKFDNYQGHSTMIYDAITYLHETLFTKGDLLRVYTNGFTTTEAWKLIENFYDQSFSRTNIRRKILNISEDTHTTKLENTTHSKIYKIKEDL